MTSFRMIALAAVLAAAAPVVPAGGALAQGIGHSVFMRGSVVGMADGVATLCIGRADGARPGQVLDVVRVRSVPGTKGMTDFRRDPVGKVRIDAVVDDHFARASVVSGQVAKHDIVELRRR